MRYLTKNLSLSCRFMIGFLLVAAFAESLRAEPVTWQILPFPTNSDWPGPKGNPAVTNDNQITLTGQPVRSVASYSAPVTIDFDVFLEARSTTDGSLLLKFQPPGTASNISADTAIFMFMIFRNDGEDQLAIYENQSTPAVWEGPFSFTAQTVHHVQVQVSVTGQLNWTIDGTSYTLPGTLDVPYPEFQLEVASWQPTAVYQVTNFSVTVGSLCPDLIGTWSGGLNTAQSRRPYQMSEFSLQVTDQSEEGCLLRGMLSGERFRKPLPFTGTAQEGTSVIFNLGKNGQASAILNTSQNPPVLEDFLFLEGNGDTAVGDLTKEVPAP